MNMPTQVVSPLRVVIYSQRDGKGSTNIDVEWAGKGLQFLLGFPDTQLAKEVYSAAAQEKTGAEFQFDTFASFAASAGIAKDFLVPQGADFIATLVDPGEKLPFGAWRLSFSRDAPLGGKAVLILLNRDRRVLARVDAPLPSVVKQ